jgi:hypothetical protein
MAPRPSLRQERAAWAEQFLLIGVDEAGRGPLAGPVVAAAVVFPPECRLIKGLRDSKLLPAGVRARLAIRIRSRALGFGVGAASAREIDRLNIRVATALAMHRALRRLLRRTPLDARPHRILIDGLPLPEIGYVHDALVDGDAHCQSIAAAAILAKTAMAGRPTWATEPRSIRRRSGSTDPAAITARASSRSASFTCSESTPPPGSRPRTVRRSSPPEAERPASWAPAAPVPRYMPAATGRGGGC